MDQGGLAPGGLNFDAKVRRESTAVDDMFIAHIGKSHLVTRWQNNSNGHHSDYLVLILSLTLPIPPRRVPSCWVLVWFRGLYFQGYGLEFLHLVNSY